MRYKNQQAIEKERSRVLGNYPYKWIKVFYLKGASYGSEPSDGEGNPTADETLVEVKGSELQQFLNEQLTKKQEEVETFKREAIDFILGGYPNAELMKHKIDVIKKTELKTQTRNE